MSQTQCYLALGEKMNITFFKNKKIPSPISNRIEYFFFIYLVHNHIGTYLLLSMLGNLQESHHPNDNYLGRRS